MRSLLAFVIVAVAFAAGCGITTLTSEPAAVAPTIEPGEQPVDVLGLAGSVGDATLTLRIFDRSLALDESRSATKHGEVIGFYLPL